MTPSDDYEPDRRVVIGIDVGTTATKAVAFCLDGQVLYAVEQAYPTFQAEKGWVEQDPVTLLRATQECLAQCVAKLGPAEILGIGVSAAMHGLLALDQHGSPLTPILTWADTRAVDEAAELRAAGQDRELHRATGTPVHPMSPLVKIMWFARNEPELSAQVDVWVSLKTWILRGLTGEVVCDLSSASDSGMLDRASGAWHPTALAWAGLEERRLPPIVPTTYISRLSAEASASTGLPMGLPVVAGAGDGPLGNLGTNALTPGTVSVSIGTSAAARAVVRGPIDYLPTKLFCYPLADDQWVVGGAASNGGSATRWTINLLSGEDLTASSETQALEAAAHVPSGSDGLCVIPYLQPERAPLWDVNIPGAVIGLRRHHTRAHLVRATLEGVVVQLNAIIDEIRLLQDVNEIRATGGAFRSPLWGRVLADMLNLPVTVTDNAQGTARGAAALALYALGVAPSLNDAADKLSQEMSTDETYTPLSANVDTYRQRQPALIADYRMLAPAVALAPPQYQTRSEHG